MYPFSWRKVHTSQCLYGCNELEFDIAAEMVLATHLSGTYMVSESIHCESMLTISMIKRKTTALSCPYTLVDTLYNYNITVGGPMAKAHRATS